MLALFVTSVATGLITTVVADQGSPATGAAGRDNLSMTSYPGERKVPFTIAAIPPQLASVPGVRAVLPIRVNPADLHLSGVLPGLIACRI